jgi:putative heme-binding domain-containing protein
MTLQHIRTFALIAVVAVASGGAAAQTFSQSAGGKQLFDALCTDCHGVNGTGDDAPAINHPLGADDNALKKIIRDGVPDRGMPRVRRMTEEEVAALAVYVRTLGNGAPTKVAGDAGKGRAVYQKLDCQACHTIGGQGGVLGPELTKIGQRRAASYLKQAVLEPGSVRSKGVQGILLNGFSEYLPVSVVSKNGSETRGIRVNEDSFTIQMRDANGKLYSFRKSELVNVDKQVTRSLMPSYKDKLSAGDADDLVAYLVSLGAAK